jgi:hypothetical protein
LNGERAMRFRRNLRVTRLWQESDHALMPDRKHPHLVVRDDESIQRYVSRLPEGNNELANVAVHATPKQWVRGKVLDGRTDGAGRCDRRVRVLAFQELEGALEMSE